MSTISQLQVRIKEIPSSVNPTPRPSTSGGRQGTSSGRPGTSTTRRSADSHQERPEVVDYEQELALAYDSAISAHHIEEASGGQGLDEIVRLTLQIDTSDKSISTLGFLVPNLRELILDHSRIASVRDLGVGLRQLLTISLNDCAINELDGIASLVNLEILSLRNNGIMDVSPIAMHDKLQKLDLHGNRIYDISAGDILSSCPKLSSLVLTKNPIDRAQHYRAVICALIPQLCELDCIPVDPDLRCKVTNAMILDTSAAMNQIREDIEDEERLEMCIMDTDNASQLHLNSQNSIDRVKNSEANRGHGRGSSALGAEPDTGSELTHGSDVVLAGGVAAAMRRRRANRAFDGGESARASYESNASDDHVNVIGLLDAMSRGSGTPSSVLESGSSSYLQEGDLTISVLGHQPRPGTSAGRPTTSSSPRPSTSLKRQKNSQSPPVPSSPSNLERKKSSNRRLLSDADESVNNISFPDPFARPNSGGRPPRSPLLGGSSPRMASPHQHNETRPGTTLSNGRPMTSYSSCSDDGANLSELAISAPSAPFKITIPLAMKGEDLNALRSRLAPPSASCSEDEGADDHDTVFSGRSTSSRSSKYKEPPLRISTARQTASATALKDLDEYDNCGGAVNKKISEHKYGAEESIQTGSNQVKGIALLGKSSIVHRDVVKRRTNRFCSDEDDDDEDIHVDHNSRHNLMTHKDRGLVGGGTSSPKVASRGAKLGADLMAQMNGSRKVDAFAIDEEIALKRKTAGSVHKNIAEDIFTSRPPVAPIGGPTLSSIAGRSLGFDLSGSLAAINQWVEDMDTAGSSDEELDEPVKPASGARTSSVGEDGGSNLIGVGNDDKSSHEVTGRSSSIGFKEDKSETSSHGSKSYSSVNREILSRQKILSMCVGKDDRDPDDSSLDNDILFIDVNSAPSKSSQKPLTTSNLAAHVESSPPSKAVIQNRPSALNTSNIAILRPSNFNSSLAVNKGSKISTQKYGGAVGDTTFRLDSCEDVEDISEDDDEGDLNDLYAENMRMIDADVSTVVSVLKNASTTPRSVQHEIEKAPLNKNKSAPSALTTRISSSDFRDFETSSPKSDLRSRGSLMDNSTNVTEKKSVPGLKNNSCGGATDLTDNELIEMLNKPPKTTYALRTKSNFQEFFRGMDAQRMKALLERAYSGEDNVAKRQEKVVKRMELLRDVLV